MSRLNVAHQFGGVKRLILKNAGSMTFCKIPHKILQLYLYIVPYIQYVCLKIIESFYSLKCCFRKNSTSCFKGGSSALGSCHLFRDVRGDNFFIAIPFRQSLPRFSSSHQDPFNVASSSSDNRGSSGGKTPSKNGNGKGGDGPLSGNGKQSGLFQNILNFYRHFEMIGV